MEPPLPEPGVVPEPASAARAPPRLNIQRETENCELPLIPREEA